jgi:hypothetical protein
MVSKFDICSKALNELGEDTINSFTEDTSRSRTCGLIYPEYIQYLLSLHPWKFTLKKVQLARLVTAPLNKWKYAYQLPSDMLILRAVYESNNVSAIPITNWERFENTVQADQSEIYVDYQQQVLEEDFPAYFVEFVVQAMAAKIARSITDDPNIVAEKKLEAWGSPANNYNGGAFGVAKKLDGMQTPTLQIPADDLLAARIS